MKGILMGLRVLTNDDLTMAVVYNSVISEPIGPIFEDANADTLAECYARYIAKRIDEGYLDPDRIQEEFQVLQQSESLHHCDCGNWSLAEEMVEATSPSECDGSKLVHTCPECAGQPVEPCCRCGGHRVQSYIRGGSSCFACRQQHPEDEEERLVAWSDAISRRAEVIDARQRDHKDVLA